MNTHYFKSFIINSRTNQFATMYAKKLGIQALQLSKVLWGPYTLDPKTKRVIKKTNSAQKELAVQFVFDNVWAVLEATEKNDLEKLEKIVSTLGLKNPKSVFKQGTFYFFTNY